MPLYEGGPLTQYSSYNAGVIPNAVYGVAINWFVNRTPLFSRLPHLPVGSPKFLVTNDNYRPRKVALTAAYTNGTSTFLTVADASSFDVGDVIQVDSEYFLVTTAFDAANPTHLVATGAYAGSTGANHASGATAYLVSNTRTGAETEVKSVSRVPQAVDQYCQTVQHAYQVGGALQSDSNWVTGFNSPLDRDRMLAMQHVVDDFEEALYYGPGSFLSGATSRPLMKGFSALLATNNTASPTNAAAYKPDDLIRDTIQACFDNGGNPNLLVVSTDFLTGLAVWGQPAMRINAGSNAFGTPIDLFEAPFLSGISIIPAPLLRKGTALCLSGPEVRVRMKRPTFDKPRGSRGDAYEGDIIMEGALEVNNEAHHAMVSGIAGFAAA